MVTSQESLDALRVETFARVWDHLQEDACHKSRSTL